MIPLLAVQSTLVTVLVILAILALVVYLVRGRRP